MSWLYVYMLHGWIRYVPIKIKWFQLRFWINESKPWQERRYFEIGENEKRSMLRIIYLYRINMNKWFTVKRNVNEKWWLSKRAPKFTIESSRGSSNLSLSLTEQVEILSSSSVMIVFFLWRWIQKKNKSLTHRKWLWIDELLIMKCLFLLFYLMNAWYHANTL